MSLEIVSNNKIFQNPWRKATKFKMSKFHRQLDLKTVGFKRECYTLKIVSNPKMYQNRKDIEDE